MKIIGVTGYYDDNQQHINQAYIKAFSREGFTPVILPSMSFGNREVNSKATEKYYKNLAKSIAEKIDILVLTGGGDINPFVFGETNYASYNTDISRDRTEIALAKAFIELKKPVMGICRGFQILGNIYKLKHYQQDLDKTDEVHSGKALGIETRNEPFHDLILFGEFLDYYKGLHGTDDYDSIRVNSWHHQGFTYKEDLKACENPNEMNDYIKSIAEETKLKILASSVSVIEAFEHSELPIFGVQWHPEEYGRSGLTIDYFLKNYAG